MFCREQAARYQAERDRFEELGLRVVAIGNGTAPMAADFVRQFAISFDVFTDPGRRAFRAAGMHRRLGFSLTTFKAAARALGGGHLQGRTKGDPLQQGGVVIVDRQGEVRFTHQQQGPGEHLPVAEVLAEARRLENLSAA